MSTVAVFLALGGVSWAAATLPRNSVGNAQIRKDAVTSSKVKDGSLSASDFGGELPAGREGQRGPEGPPGQQGEPGPQGPAGAAGINGYAARGKIAANGALTGSVGIQSASRIFPGLYDIVTTGSITGCTPQVTKGSTTGVNVGKTVNSLVMDPANKRITIAWDPSDDTEFYFVLFCGPRPPGPAPSS